MDSDAPALHNARSVNLRSVLPLTNELASDVPKPSLNASAIQVALCDALQRQELERLVKPKCTDESEWYGKAHEEMADTLSAW